MMAGVGKDGQGPLVTPRRSLVTSITALVLGIVFSGCASSSSWQDGGSFEPAFSNQNQSSFADSASIEELDAPLEGGYASETPVPVLDENSTLEDYLEYASHNNPGLEAAFNMWKATLEKVTQVQTLPDPRFTYGYFLESVETRVGPQEHVLAIAQTFPWFGKLRLRGEKAFEASEVFRHRF